MHCSSSFLRRVSIVLFFFAGSCVPVLNRVLLRGQFPWHHGLELEFRKPWFQLLAQFLGMSLFIIPSVIYRRIRTHSPNYLVISTNTRIFPRIVFPSLCNIIASILQNQALVYVHASVWQVFYGFQVLFATLFSVTLRRSQLFLADWTGLFVTVSGMAFTGVAALLRGISIGAGEQVSEIFTGFVLAIASNGVRAFQTILEEKLLHDSGINGATLTAYEGIWGTYICVFILLPLCQIVSPTHGWGFYENTVESFQMLGHSLGLGLLVLSYLFFVTFYSYFGIVITDLSSAIHRNLYEMIRPLPVWALSTVSYYIAKTSAGEPLDRFTPLEVAGFAVSIGGSLIYNRIARFPCFTYPERAKLRRGTAPLLDSQPIPGNYTESVSTLGAVK
jgi:drug/metabolite transporter (DMT)-like permease